MKIKNHYKNPTKNNELIALMELLIEKGIVTEKQIKDKKISKQNEKRFK
jgi:hypothetical protein